MREVMSPPEFQATVGNDDLTTVWSLDGYRETISGLDKFARLLSRAKALESQPTKEAFNTASSELLAEAASVVRGLMRSTATLSGSIGTGQKTWLNDLRTALVSLGHQLRDEAMIQIIDLAVDAEKKFTLVQSADVPGAEEKVGDNRTGDGGRFTVLREKLGSGAVNTVSLLEDNEGEQYIFKADQKKGMVALDEAGSDIARGATAFSNRSVAMYRLDQLLGFGVIPETQFAEKDGMFGHVMKLAGGASPQQETKLSPFQAAQAEDPEGLAWAQKVKNIESNVDGYYTALLDTQALPGSRDVVFDVRASIAKSFGRINGERFVIKHAYNNFDYRNADIQEGLTSLHLVDLIAGQLDRHPGNYFIGVDPSNGRLRVTAIDNDAAFGATHDDLNKNIRSGHLPGLPSVVSEEQWQRIERITGEQIAEVLGDLLSEAEVASTIARFEQLKAHLRELSNAGQLVDSFDRSTYVKMVQAEAEEQPAGQAHLWSSYVGREATFVKEKAKVASVNLIIDAQMVPKTAGVPTADPLTPNRDRPLPPTPGGAD